MFTFLVLLCVANMVVGDECEPGFADTCFKAVIDDLKYMIDLRKNQAINITGTAVKELCLSLDDSLNCTSDIIDGECSDQEGKLVFDSWLEALRGAYYYVCDGTDHKGLTDILRGASCWSIDDFILCTEEKTGLTNINQILHTPMDEIACNNLHLAMSKCRQDAGVGSCREQDYVFRAVDHMIGAFFDASECVVVHHGQSNSSPGNLRAVLSPIFAVFIQLIVFMLVL